jgi:hypothetical protein
MNPRDSGQAGASGCASVGRVCPDARRRRRVDIRLVCENARGVMSYRAIYTYPWDLADEGVDAVVRDVERLGLDTITIAGSYHAGKFLRPHGRGSRVMFPEDGTVYFRPFLTWRRGVVTSLVREIREAVRQDVTLAIIPSVARPTATAWYEGTDLRALAEIDGVLIEACFYESSAERVRADCADVCRRDALAGIADAVKAFGG